MDQEEERTDIGVMVRTFVFLNDPRVKQVTTRFLAIAVAIAAIGAVYAFSVSTGIEEAPASDADAVGAESATWPREICMDQAEAGTWVASHPDVRVLEVVERPGGQVCLRYAPVAHAF